MVPQILYHLSPGVAIAGLVWDSGSNATNLVFLGISGNTAHFRVTAATVFGPGLAPLIPGAVLFIPVYQVQSIAL